MLVNQAATREWKATDYPGIERSLFRHNDTGGRSSVVLAGRVQIGGTALDAGDYLFTEPGEEHDVVALTDATIFVSSQRATPVVE